MMTFAQTQELYMPKDGKEQEELIARAIDAWLDKKFSEFGRVSLRAVAAVSFAALVYWILISHGWKAPFTQ